MAGACGKSTDTYQKVLFFSIFRIVTTLSQTFGSRQLNPALNSNITDRGDLIKISNMKKQ